MNAKNITKDNMFKGQGAGKVVADILHAIETLGAIIDYYVYDTATEVFENPVSLPVYLQDIEDKVEGGLFVDRELRFIFSTESFVSNSIIPNITLDKAVYEGVTYELVSREYVNSFAHVSNLLENSILVSFKAIKRTKIKRSDVL